VRLTATLLTCALGAAGALSACSGGGTAGSGARSRTAPSATLAAAATVRAPQQAQVLVPGTDPSALSAGASRAVFASARQVVLVSADDPASLTAAADLAGARREPVLAVGSATADEVSRLGARTVVPVGAGAKTWAQQQYARGATEVLAAPTPSPSSTATATPSPGSSASASATRSPGRRTSASSTVVLTDGSPVQAAAAATARAAGAQVSTVTGGDPRSDGSLVHDLAGHAPEHTVALGDAFGSPDLLAQRMATVATGAQVPGGGQLPLAGRRLVALYGHPGTASLGVLGEQPLQATLARATQVASTYQGLGGLPAVPALDLIATVASGSPGADGDYSAESSVEDLRPWVEAAQQAGVYVVLDLQSGRSDFLSQAKQYQSLLEQPGVGLAVDPEWRLTAGQQPLQQIGSVDVGEINQVSAWLAGVVQAGHLPQKVFLVHQFRLSMIRGRDQLDTGHDELVTVIHGDGNGTPDLKYGTWKAITAAAPPGVVWGWKDFYDEDSPMLTPQQTVAVTPSPVFVSYQ
jgi:hypothetical protein